MSTICWVFVVMMAGTVGRAPRALVVVDPGHGGSNLGAPSYGGVAYEKQVTLDLGSCVRDRLLGKGLRAVLTREDDRYLSLRERMNKAHQLNADMFVSLHANATDAHDQQGFETYILTPRALETESRALRADDGAIRPGLDAATAQLLDDVERGLALPAAAALAQSIQDHLKAVRGAARDRGVRQHAMHVLLGATMPAVLVEVGFLDHPVEGPELLDGRTRQQICGALADGIVAGLP
jgi:N-acetylmuramoyl-L-alanine amidase